MRPFTWSVGALLAALAALPPSSAEGAATCSCERLEDLKAARPGVTALFTGVVLADSVIPSPPFPASDSLLWMPDRSRRVRKVTLMVEHAWKLPARTQADSVLVPVWTIAGGSECGFHFTLGERYLVVALSGAALAGIIDSAEATPGRTRLSSMAGASLWTFMCSGTRHMREARRALEELGPAVPVVDSVRRPPNG